jgi:hypothetical protein
MKEIVVVMTVICHPQLSRLVAIPFAGGSRELALIRGTGIEMPA